MSPTVHLLPGHSLHCQVMRRWNPGIGKWRQNDGPVFLFVFVCHSLDDFKVGYIKWLITVLIVLTYATVGPIAFLNGALVFLPSGLTATASLATIVLVAFRAYVYDVYSHMKCSTINKKRHITRMRTKEINR